jgi:hypothetical protein
MRSRLVPFIGYTIGDRVILSPLGKTKLSETYIPFRISEIFDGTEIGTVEAKEAETRDITVKFGTDSFVVRPPMIRKVTK